MMTPLEFAVFMRKTLVECGVEIKPEDDLEVLYTHHQNIGTFHKKYQCGDKHQYLSILVATKEAYRMSEWRGADFEPYTCQWCGFYHVGHSKDRTHLKKFIRKDQTPVRQFNRKWN